MSHEDRFQRERGAIFSSAIGLARLALKSGEPDKALEYLDDAVDEADDAWRTALLADGYAEPLIVQFLGPPRSARLDGTLSALPDPKEQP